MEVGEWGIGNFDYLSGNILDMEKKASYIVYYSSGEYDDYKEVCIFVTESKNKAVRYAQKFNRILKKWKLYFANFEKNIGISWYDHEKHGFTHYNRWYQIKGINGCRVNEIERR